VFGYRTEMSGYAYNVIRIYDASLAIIIKTYTNVCLSKTKQKQLFSMPVLSIC